MRKIIKKWGDSFVVVLSKEDMESYGLEEGEVIEFDNLIKVKIKKEEKNARKS